MILQSAINKFLARKLQSYDWLKGEASARLDAALAELKPPPDFNGFDPWSHQKAAFLILNELRRFMLHIDMGGGKTRICLMLLKYLKQCGEKPRAIVFVPYVTSVATWIDEVAERTSELKCVPLTGTIEQNLDTLSNAKGDLFVMAYQSAVAMVSYAVPSKKKNGKKQWKLKASEVRRYFAGFNVFVGDEIHKAKSISSLTFRMCRAISAQCDWAIGLTGTPFNKDVADLWPQFCLIDFGETLGPTLGFYRAVYFTEKRNYWGGFEYKFQKKLLPQLQENIRNCSISYPIEDLHDMPERKFIIRRIGSGEGQASYIKEALKRVKDAVGNGTGALQAIESNYLQLRQLSSGFMTLKGENSSRVQIKFEDNPKLDVLIDLIDSMPVGRKMVVFQHFIFSNKMISEKLTELGIEHARIWSGQKDPIGELKRFKQSKKCRVLVLNDKMGSSSLNLQHANYCVFFESPDSAIDRQQAERRVWRPGQQHKVIYYDLFVNGTYDESIYRSNKAGESLLKKLLRGKSNA